MSNQKNTVIAIESLNKTMEEENRRLVVEVAFYQAQMKNLEEDNLRVKDVVLNLKVENRLIEKEIVSLKEHEVTYQAKINQLMDEINILKSVQYQNKTQEGANPFHVNEIESLTKSEVTLRSR